MLATAAKVGRVKTVAIVDDAYDPPRSDKVSENAFNVFVQEFENDSSVRDSLERLLTAKDLDDYERFIENEQLVHNLWSTHVGEQRQTSDKAAYAALAKLFADIQLDRASKLLELKPLEQLLESARVSVIRLGSNPDPQSVAKADVVFLDLYLSDDVPAKVSNEDRPPRSVYERARDRALQYLASVRALTANDVSAVAPAFVLISSQGSDRIAENFRKRSGQMASRFRFVPKSGVADKDPHVLLAIADIFRTCAACGVVEPLQKALPTAIREAAEWVLDKLMALDIADFGRLYQLRLQKEGQPVDDYVKELISSALAERVLHEFGQLGLASPGPAPFKDVAAYIEPPSNGFAELYSATRISTEPGYRGASGLDPQSGDLYLIGGRSRARHSMAGRELLAVMSPACDLVDRNDEKRKGLAAKSLLLLPGMIRSFEHAADQLLYHDGRYYEIEWTFKRPETMELGAFWKRRANRRLTWIGRIKSDHFYALQSRYLSDLGRVGVIVPPRVFEPLRGEISFKHDGDRHSIGAEFAGGDRYAFLAANKEVPDKQPIFFTGSFLQYFWSVLIQLRDDSNRPQVLRTKVKGLLDEISKVLDLTQMRAASKHCIPNQLAVELHQSRDEPIKESGKGVLVIRLWRD